MLILFLTTGVFASGLHRLSLTVVYVLLCYNNASKSTVMEMLVISVKSHIELQEETLIHIGDLGTVSFPASGLVAV